MRDPEKEYENAQDVQMDMKRAQESNQLATNLQPCKQDDLISRQAAIDVLDRNHILGQGLLNDTLDHIADVIMALPSAQPETHDKRTETHACDLISRQSAIEAMENVDWYHIGKDGQLVHGANSKEDEPLYKAEDVYKVLNDVPSAQPEIIHCGECKHRDPEDHKCDCGHDIIWQLPRDDKWYCADAERRTDGV